jgi:hypothetical protein
LVKIKWHGSSMLDFCLALPKHRPGFLNDGGSSKSPPKRSLRGTLVHCDSFFRL